MKRAATLSAALMAMVTPAVAVDIKIEIDNFTAVRGISELVLRVTNNSSQVVSDVFIDCVFMTEDERAIDIGKALISRIPPGGTKFDKAAIPTTEGVAKAQCDVDRYR